MASPVRLWRPIPADATRYFDAESFERGKAYQRPKQRAKMVRALALAATLVGLIWARFAPELLDRLDIGAWPGEAVVVIALTIFLVGLPAVPMDVWEEFVHEKRWGFSTQTPRGWIVDDVKEFIVFGVVLLSAILLPLWVFIRATDLWWLWGGIAVTGVGLFFGIIYPIAILPVFNKFTPLADDELRARLEAVADRAGVRIGEFLVMDASKRSRKDNAFFVGIGATRRVVLYDNILQLPPECIQVVIAHEIGHWRRSHTLIGTLLSVVQLPAMLAIVAAIVTAGPVLRWAGVDSLGDPAAIPLFLLVAGGVQAVLSRADAWLSRWFERQADLDALELTRAPAAFASTWRHMVDRNLPDLDPSWWVRSRLTHPPVAQRMAFGEAWSAANDITPEPAPTG